MSVLETVVLGNSIETWTFAFGATLLSFVLLRVVAVRGLRRLLKVASTEKYSWDDVLLTALNATKPGLLFLVAAFAGSLVVSLPPAVAQAIQSVAIVALLVQTGLWADGGLSRWLEIRSAERAAVDPAEVMTEIGRAHV